MSEKRKYYYAIYAQTDKAVAFLSAEDRDAWVEYRDHFSIERNETPDDYSDYPRKAIEIDDPIIDKMMDEDNQ